MGNIYAKRTPWYTQTDLQLANAFKVNSYNEAQQLSFNATALNLLNRRAVVSDWDSINSYWSGNSLCAERAINRDLYEEPWWSGFLPGGRNRL